MTAHDIRFVEDNWESPVMCETMFYGFSISFSFSLYSQCGSVCFQVLGAWGLGWEIWMDGMEITQFTYFQQVIFISNNEL